MPAAVSFKHVSTAHDTHVLLSCTPRLPVLIVCDHASNFVPAELGKMGLEAHQLDAHIGWDIGAGAVARKLGELLGAPVVLAATSRLVVDCNRNLDDPNAFPEYSDEILIPANQNLSPVERAARADRFYWPYHHAVRDQVRLLEQIAAAPAIVAVHSFTPTMNGIKRPWHIGALWDKDSRIAAPFMAALSKRANINVGDNEPYSGRHPADFTLDHHAEAEGLPHLGIEIRQDLIGEDGGAIRWATTIAEVLSPVFADPTLFTHRAGHI